MKGQVEILFFNGAKERCSLDMHIAGHVFLNTEESPHPKSPSTPPFPEEAVSTANAAVLDILKENMDIHHDIQIGFDAYSLKLEQLGDLQALPDPMQLAQLLGASVLLSILADVGAEEAEKNTPLHCSATTRENLKTLLEEQFGARIAEHKEGIKETFFKKPSPEVSPIIQRAEALEKSGDLLQAQRLLEDLALSESRLTPTEQSRLAVLLFKVRTQADRSDDGFVKNRELYEKMQHKHAGDSETLRHLSLTWIRYLQDRRDFGKTFMEAKKSFEESFPESTLSPKEKALLEYLRGRSEYHKGEYIGALELLDKAYRAADKKDEEFISDILNTAASSFTDNLFFEHARILLREALAIREKLSLGTKAETISAIGVLAFKNGNFDEAYSLFTQALREMRTSNFVKDENRILNYLAKAALYKGDSATSDTFLDEALGKADRVEQKLFSHAIRMASLVMRKEFQSAHELFQETFLLPEHHQHCFPVAWGYFFEAEASFQLGRLKDAIRHQARCVDLFLSDRFILEAGLASIKPFLWNPDIEHLELFYENINEENIVNELIEYRDNHEDLPERFFTEFFDKNDSATHPETSSLRGLADLPQRFLSNLFSGGIFNRESKGAMLSKTIDMIISATQAKSAQKARKTLEHAYFL